MTSAQNFDPTLFLLAHLIGDYVLQSDWMASSKTKSSWPALAHAITYTIPFLLLGSSSSQVLFIAATHFVIDRWRLARYVCWAKNWLAPKWLPPSESSTDPPCKEGVCAAVWRRNYPWVACAQTGYGPDKPLWMSVWLLIITDNAMHLCCNYFALKHL